MNVVDAMISSLTEVVFKSMLQQAQYTIDFKSELEIMKTQLELLKAFLSDTENIKYNRDLLKIIFYKTKELLYQADDILTDCIVRDEYQSEGSRSSYSPGELLFKYRVGQMLKQVNSEMMKVERVLSGFLNPEKPNIQGNKLEELTRFTSQDIDPSEVIGLESDMEKIKQWIFSQNEVLHLVGIVGMGGLGKTTIALKIFNDHEVFSQFDKMVWLSVSQVVDEERIMRSMLEQLEQYSGVSDKKQMLPRVLEVLEGESCLIVMDDVWKIPNWWFRFCSGLPKPEGRSSCVIITTRIEGVAVNMGVAKSRIHRPGGLNKDESWSLFSLCAFCAHDGKCPNPQIEKVIREIVEKCQGLPLAIKTVGGLLSSKIHLFAEWKQMNDDKLDEHPEIVKVEKVLSRFLTPKPSNIQGDRLKELTRFTSKDIGPYEVIRLESDKEKIKQWIFSQNEVLHRVGIVGMGNLGKTTIAQKIFNDREVFSQFELMIWVSVSQAVDEERIMRSMLEQLGLYTAVSDKGQMLRRLFQILEGKSCLIVMDDVWKIPDWWTRLCSGLPKPKGRSSCVIITTRIEGVAVDMGVDKSRIHRLRVLNKDESWSLFSLYAFCAHKGNCLNPQTEKVGREIVEKCRGLPLAIKTIGGLLSSKVHSFAEWKKINDEFHELTRGDDSSVAASLQLSYDELPSRLKQCLLCFSIYPEDSEIQAEQLVHWWIAENFIQDKDLMTASEQGYEYLSELVSRCLIDAVQRRGYDGRIYSCRMHDLVRDMTIRIAQDEGFCSYNTWGKQKLTADSRWLGFSSDTDAKSLKNNMNLRAFLLISGCPFFINNPNVVLRSLRVLDVSNSKLDIIQVEHLLGLISSLKRLACLNLSQLTMLKEVPSSIRRLYNLQILVLTGCSNLVRVHNSITSLKRLVILDLGSCGLEYLPRELSKLHHIQELSGLRLANNLLSCRLRDIENLVELRVLRMSVNNGSEIAADEREVLSNLEKLKVLSIDAEDSRDEKIFMMLDQLSPPPQLQELHLRRYRSSIMPKWISAKQLLCLQYLCLEHGDLYNIIPDVEEIYCIWNLEGLCLKALPNLVEDWNELVQKMPLLHYVEVSRCFNLKDFPCPVDRPGIWRKNVDIQSD